MNIWICAFVPVTYVYVEFLGLSLSSVFILCNTKKPCIIEKALLDVFQIVKWKSMKHIHLCFSELIDD